jgi:hypothetical protein
MNDIKTGAALWQLSTLLSESENELWLLENIHLFFLPMRLGSTFILLTVISENALFKIDLNTLSVASATSIPIRQEFHNVPIYSLLRKPIDKIVLTDSVIYNMTADSYITEYNLKNIISFLRSIIIRSPKNAHEGLLRDVLFKKIYDGKSFFEYIDN